MPNSAEHAERWAKFVAARPEIRNASRIFENFEAGQITWLCDCGCHSFDIEIPEPSTVTPIVSPSERGGMVVQLEFHTQEEGRTVGFSVFADQRGYLSGIDVDCSGNSYPMPDAPELKEPPYHVYGELKA